MEWGLPPATTRDEREKIRRWFAKDDPKQGVQHQSEFVYRLRLLKNKIGLMDNEAQLEYLTNLPETKPELAEKGGDIAVQLEAQENYQLEADYNGFISAYKEYLIEKIAGYSVINTKDGVVSKATNHTPSSESLLHYYKKVSKEKSGDCRPCG